MNTFGKITLAVFITLAVVGLGFLIDAKVFDRGEETRAPSVGIKAAAVEPKFVTVNSQPVVSVFVKGEASRVWLEVAPRVDPTQGGETLATYDLSPYELLPASKLSPEDTGDVCHWATIIHVPQGEGQYLLTAHASDSTGRETKFKMFNSILAVQPVREQLAGDTPGQSTILKFIDFINNSKSDEAAELLTPELRGRSAPFDLFAWPEAVVTAREFELQEISLADGRERDRVKLTDGTAETEFSVDLIPNQEKPLSKWQISNVEKLK